MSQKILIIVAHPDDEVLGCGATIARLSRQGNEIYCLILGEGITSRYAIDSSKAHMEKEELREVSQKAAKILGIKQLFFENFPDQRMDSIPLLEIIKAIEKVKEQVKPEIVYTHHQGDLNIDHQITFRAVLTACRPVKGETVKEIYSFEIPSSTEWSSPTSHNYFIPNVFVDISDTYNKKIEALKAYKSEIREYPHPRSPEALEIIARRWGTIIGKTLIEAFELIRWIK